MEPFEAHGHFWLPGHDDHPVAGVLSFDRQTGGQLALIGALHEQPIIDSPEAVDRLILGVVGNDEVTLVRCQLRNTVMRMLGGFEETWMPYAILRGACLDRTEDLAFDNVYFELDALLEWTDSARIQRDYRQGEGRRLTEVTVQLNEKPAETVGLDHGGILELRFPWSTEGDGVRHSAVRQSCALHRSWALPQGLEEVLKEIRLFQHLIAIAVNAGCSYGEITLQHPESSTLPQRVNR